MTKDMEIQTTIYQPAQPGRQDSVWYDGEIALLEAGDRRVLVLAAGEVRIMSPHGYVKLPEIGVENDLDLEKTVGHDYNDPFYWQNNNWFESLYAMGVSHFEYFIGDVSFGYDEAMDAARELLSDDGFWARLGAASRA